ncbi:MAG: LysM peptidoglycan-binding domain-containing M23 family metallopeptidase [Synergistaceae bacterium]|nr:LysM peptidoglycan-binding domain-containing M23 family metallopeptidase [Synergistaceae bacterium]
MKSELNRPRNAYSKNKGKTGRGKKHAGASLAFCWGFGFVVCGVFGLASYLMISAGHFDFSTPSGVEAAWGGIDGEETLVTGNLIKVEVTDLDGAKSEGLYAQLAGDVVAEREKLDEFGPLPKYLSDYESIILNVNEDGTSLPANEEEEDTDKAEIITPIAPIAPILVENAVTWREHVVRNGETLSDIAAAHGNITADEILRANGLKNANKLSENQLLLIPNDSSKIEETLDEVRTRQMRVAAGKEKVEPVKTKTYVVAKGDSLWSIANSQGIEVDTLIGSNNFKSSSRLRPGAMIRIPNQDGIFYVMKTGEKIEDIAKRYGVSMNKLRMANTDINTASLKTGDEVFLPGAKSEGVLEHREKDVKIAEAKKAVSAKNQKTAAKNERAEKPQKGEVAVRRTSGGFRWPIMGRINSPFGWRYHPITKRRDFHTGIDIKANRNDPIKAAGAGKIVYSGWMGGYGKVLVIEHNNGQSTLYAHCSTLLVGKGANVTSGQLVAKVGTTGRSTGPHLHFEVRNGNSPVNPIKYLSR